MIEPQSAQDGASAWDVKVTWALPMPKLPSMARVAAAPFPLLFPLAWPFPLVEGAAEEEPTPPALALGASDGRSAELSRAGGGVAASSLGAATAVAPLNGEAGLGAAEPPLPELPALPAPAAPPNPRGIGWT